MRLIQELSNNNLDRNRVARIYQSDTLPGYNPTFEVSTHSGGVGVDWEFRTFTALEDAQLAAMHFIAPQGILCKILS